MLKNQIAILQCVVVLMCMQVSPLSTENEWSNIESFCLQALDNRNKSLLLVVAGIGPVVNLRFTDTFSAVLWDPPATAGVLSGLSYIVIVTNNNTGQVIVNTTTTNTIYPLPVLKLCQYYTANVTAFLSQHCSESAITGQKTPGGKYNRSDSFLGL